MGYVDRDYRWHVVRELRGSPDPLARRPAGAVLARVLFLDHTESCPTRLAEACSVPIECEHGYDVCPVCDACTCGTDAPSDQPD
jgi:hypothetical protein